MLFRNLSYMEIKEISSLIDSHSFLLQNHFGDNLPFERVSSKSYPIKETLTKEDQLNKTRIDEIINRFVNKKASFEVTDKIKNYENSRNKPS